MKTSFVNKIVTTLVTDWRWKSPQVDIKLMIMLKIIDSQWAK